MKKILNLIGIVTSLPVCFANLIQSAEREEDSVARLRYVDAIIAIDPTTDTPGPCGP